MNKNRINKMLPMAYDAISDCQIAKNGEVNKAYRSQISTLGAAITTGSLEAAIAFFSDKGSAEVDRRKLLRAILQVLQQEKQIQEKDLFEYAQKCKTAKEDILNAAIAIKLAMNLYKLVQKGE